MKVPHLYTKDQTLRLFEAWKVTEKLPGKGKKVLIAFAKPAKPNLATVTLSMFKSTYGKRLYSVNFEQVD